MKHANFAENALKRKNDCVYENYYSGEDEPSEEVEMIFGFEVTALLLLVF